MTASRAAPSPTWDSHIYGTERTAIRRLDYHPPTISSCSKENGICQPRAYFEPLHDLDETRATF